MSRFWARVCIIMATMFVLLVIVGSMTQKSIFVIVGGVFMIGALLIKYLVLRCPYCGFMGAVPQWSSNKPYYCPKCGKKLEYDK